MWQTLAWHRLSDAHVAQEVEDLRKDTLRIVLLLSVAGYLIWHCTAATVAPIEQATRDWLLFPIVLAGFGASAACFQRWAAYATPCFLITSSISLVSATWILHSDAPITICPFVVLAAAFLTDPLTGLAAAVGFACLLGTLWHLGPLAFLPTSRLVDDGVASLLAVLAAWAFGRNVVTTVDWALDAYEKARQSAESAQHHRAELVHALNQLDSAYYRLERANAALELAWKAAESAERSKSEFVANISHELRTPLNLIVGFSELVVTSPESYGAPLPASYYGDLNAIYRSAQHLLNLTEDILDLARVGIGRLTLFREFIDLRQIINDAHQILREYLTTKGLSFRVDAPDDVPLAYVDRLRVRQVLLNLLTNAARFTEKGGITISLVIKDSQFVTVNVTDSGKGIPPSDLHRVFDPYYHSEERGVLKTVKYEGVGLGLPLSKRLVELHGGEMGVESTLGAGTTFWFRLPTAAVDGAATDDHWHPLRDVEAPSGILPLLVLAGATDDLAQLLQKHLNGFRVVATADLREAIAMSVELHARAILTDVDLTQQVAGLEAPVPILTLPLPHRQQLAATPGVAASLIKPVTRSALHELLTTLSVSVRTALVVDDDPRFGRLMARYLKSFNQDTRVEIVLAQNGREALRVLEQTRPDIVLLDLIMPDLNGREVLTAMAAIPHLKDVPVIVISAQEDSPVLLRGPLVIEKAEGFRFGELVRAVETVLGVLDPPQRYLTKQINNESFH